MPPLAPFCVSPYNLTIHPLAASVPLLPENHPASVAILASICDLGITSPLLVTKGRVIDGRLRLQSALALALAEVPVLEIDEKDITSVMIHSLAARKHLTKSALAYLCFPLMEAAIAESSHRRLNNLRGMMAGKEEARPGMGSTAQEQADKLGFGRGLLFRAKEIHAKFGEYGQLRSKWEPKILNGEMGLGQVQQAIAGKIAALEGRTTPNVDSDAGRLLAEAVTSLGVRVERWPKLTPEKQLEINTLFCQQVAPKLPRALQQSLKKALTEILKTPEAV